MKTSLVCFVAAAFAVGALSVSAAAQAPAKKAAAAKLGPNQKLCKSKQPNGAIKSWTCGKEQPCCVNHTFNLYTCGSKLLQCF